jgi:hypothetical protein
MHCPNIRARGHKFSRIDSSSGLGSRLQGVSTSGPHSLIVLTRNQRPCQRLNSGKPKSVAAISSNLVGRPKVAAAAGIADAVPGTVPAAADPRHRHIQPEPSLHRNFHVSHS